MSTQMVCFLCSTLLDPCLLRRPYGSFLSAFRLSRRRGQSAVCSMILTYFYPAKASWPSDKTKRCAALGAIAEIIVDVFSKKDDTWHCKVKLWHCNAKWKFPKQVYLWRVLTALKGVHARAAWFGVCLRVCFPAKDTLDSLSALVRMISLLSPTCLPLHSGFSARMISHFPPTCLPLYSGFFACIISGLSPTCLHFSPTCLHLSPSPFWMLWVLWSAWFRPFLPLVSHSCLRLHSGFSSCMSSHLSPTCLPVRSGWSQCSASHDFKLVSHLSTLVSPFSQRHGSFCVVCGTTTTTNTNHRLQPLLAQTSITMNLDDLQTNCLGIWGQCWYNSRSEFCLPRTTQCFSIFCDLWSWLYWSRVEARPTWTVKCHSCVPSRWCQRHMCHLQCPCTFWRRKSGRNKWNKSMHRRLVSIKLKLHVSLIGLIQRNMNGLVNPEQAKQSPPAEAKQVGPDTPPATGQETAEPKPAAAVPADGAAPAGAAAADAAASSASEGETETPEAKAAQKKADAAALDAVYELCAVCPTCLLMNPKDFSASTHKQAEWFVQIQEGVIFPSYWIERNLCSGTARKALSLGRYTASWEPEAQSG